MSEKKVRLIVSTPDRTVLDRSVDFVVLRTSEGDMGVLPGHAPCSVLLDYGMLRAYIDRKKSDVLAVLGGFATVEDNQVVVMSAVADLPDKIEDVIADIEKQRAENKRNEQSANLEMHRAEKALRRTLVHMDVSSYSIGGGAKKRQD